MKNKKIELELDDCVNKLRKDIVEKLTNHNSFVIDLKKHSVHVDNNSYLDLTNEKLVKIDYTYLENKENNNEMNALLNDVQNKTKTKDLQMNCGIYIHSGIVLDLRFVFEKYNVSFTYKDHFSYQQKNKSYDLSISFDKDFVVDYLEKEGLKVTLKNDLIGVTL